MTDRLHQEHLGACRSAFEGAHPATASVLFLGEDNPQSARPEHALFNYPEGCAGHRLQSKILGVDRLNYLATWRTNLCNPTWSLKAARLRVAELFSPANHASAPLGVKTWRTVILLGRKVADAVGFVADREIPAFTSYQTNGFTLVSLPHPSGRNLIWNDRQVILNARALLREVCPDYPWGITESHDAATLGVNS